VSQVRSHSDLLVDLRDVVKAYTTPAGAFLALRGVDLEVRPGEFVAVIGKSGSGKSTLINTITGIDRPTSGEVHVAGTAVHRLDENQLATWRGANVGVIFQFFQLLPTLTLLENVMLPMEFARRGSSRTRRDRALALLDRVGMGEHAGKLPSQVSGGQQQRVAIARALANDPILIVADEPTGSLDSRTADTVFQLFEELVDHGKTILMVTHDNDLADRASRVVLIADGEVVERQVRSALAGLTEKELSGLTARMEPIALRPGMKVFEEGDDADRFYIIVRGDLEVVRTRLDGSDEVVAVLGPGQYFGEVGLLQGRPRNASVMVSGDGDASLLALDADVFRQMVSDNAVAHDGIAREMRKRMNTDVIRRAVPEVTEEHLARLSGQVERLEFQPGETILGPGDRIDRFHVVSAGEAEVVSDDGSSVSLRFRPGRHIGPVGLSLRGESIAHLRASPDHPEGTILTSIPDATYRALAEDTGLGDEQIALLVVDASRG
jgi:ABC-type lipoprotein export system ATPase subunit/CRP-like cAMP-binding protein